MRHPRARSKRSTDLLEPLIDRLGMTSGAFEADVTIRDEVQRMIAAVDEQLGPVDILVNNAGVLRPTKIVDIAEEVGLRRGREPDGDLYVFTGGHPGHAEAPVGAHHQPLFDCGQEREHDRRRPLHRRQGGSGSLATQRPRWPMTESP